MATETVRPSGTPSRVYRFTLTDVTPEVVVDAAAPQAGRSGSLAFAFGLRQCSVAEVAAAARALRAAGVPKIVVILGV